MGCGNTKNQAQDTIISTKNQQISQSTTQNQTVNTNPQETQQKQDAKIIPESTQQDQATNINPSKTQPTEPVESATQNSNQPLQLQQPTASVKIQEQSPQKKPIELVNSFEQQTAKRLRTSNLLFFFDFAKRIFNYFDSETSAWKSNDLNAAQNDCPKCPLMLYKNGDGNKQQVDEQLSTMSFVLSETGSVYIIGSQNSQFSNLEYSISQNKFTAKAKMLKNVNNPNLCYASQFIYSISGDAADNYSTRFDRYDISKNEWTELPALPQPHAFGAALCVVTSDSNGSSNAVKILVAGGLCQKIPRKFNSSLSLFDLAAKTWSRIELKSLLEQVPRFLRSPLVQDETGNIHILGAEGTVECFVVDLDKKTAKQNGKLARDDDPEKAGYLSDAVLQGGYAYSIYKRQNLRETEGKLGVHKGNLESGRWEVV